MSGAISISMTVVWLCAMIVLLIVEAMVPGLVSIWFALGALAALISALLKAPLWLQLLWFVVVSVATLLITRPLAKKLTKTEKVATNADRVLNQIGIVQEEDIITFGVLHMLSFATLIVAAVYALSRLAKGRGDLVFFIASAALTGLIFLANYLIGRADVQPSRWLMFLHESFADIDWTGGDYFPLLPYLGYAFGGAAAVTLLYGGGRSLLPKCDGVWNKPFRFVGRHTLVVVIVHQVINMSLLALVTALFVDFGNFVIFG